MGNTFCPPASATREAQVDDTYDVTISKPAGGEPVGITVLLGGALLQLSDYKSTSDVLLGQKQLVIGFNKLIPKIFWFGKTHDQMAEDVRGVVERETKKYNFSKYNIVGHSMGGKVALLVAAKFDIKNVKIVIALDPVDLQPQEISNGKVDLNKATARLYLTRAEQGGTGSPDGSNAVDIQKKYPAKIPLDTPFFTMHKGAGHMSYTDNGGGLVGGLVSPKGDPAANKAARDGAHQLIKDLIV
jgi:dienelactone hydrolase